jgi:hypothetical protein
VVEDVEHGQQALARILAAALHLVHEPAEEPVVRHVQAGGDQAALDRKYL